MIKIEKIEVSNFKSSFRGMRNPLESWDKSDSLFGVATESEFDDIQGKHESLWLDQIHSDVDMEKLREWYWNNYILQYDEHALEYALLGPNDLNLAKRLILSGPDHSKFMRQIFVSMDITAPLYWFKELDTYKVGTVANSCSTMHKLATTPITRDCFSFDKELDYVDTQFYGQEIEGFKEYFSIGLMNDTTINNCERLRKKYLETKDARYWRALIQLLPSSWNQTRTWTADYAVLRNIYFARKNHKLTEWITFCEEIEKLPYGKDLICITKNEQSLEIP